MPKILWNRSWAVNWARRNSQITGVWSANQANASWRPVYVLWPRKTISGRWAFLEHIYFRVLWVEWNNDLEIEREVQYADEFGIIEDPFRDMIRDSSNNEIR